MGNHFYTLQMIKTCSSVQMNEDKLKEQFKKNVLPTYTYQSIMTKL